MYDSTVSTKLSAIDQQFHWFFGISDKKAARDYELFHHSKRNTMVLVYFQLIFTVIFIPMDLISLVYPAQGDFEPIFIVYTVCSLLGLILGWIIFSCELTRRNTTIVPTHSWCVQNILLIQKVFVFFVTLYYGFFMVRRVIIGPCDLTNSHGSMVSFVQQRYCNPYNNDHIITADCLAMIVITPLFFLNTLKETSYPFTAFIFLLCFLFVISSAYIANDYSIMYLAGVWILGGLFFMMDVQCYDMKIFLEYIHPHMEAIRMQAIPINDIGILRKQSSYNKRAMLRKQVSHERYDVEAVNDQQQPVSGEYAAEGLFGITSNRFPVMKKSISFSKDPTQVSSNSTSIHIPAHPHYQRHMILSRDGNEGDLHDLPSNRARAKSEESGAGDIEVYNIHNQSEILSQKVSSKKRKHSNFSSTYDGHRKNSQASNGRRMTAGTVPSHEDTDMNIAHANEIRSMIGNIAHDLKTPLASYLAGTEYLSQLVLESSALLQQHMNQVPNPSNAKVQSLHQNLFESLGLMKDGLQHFLSIYYFMVMIVNRCLDYHKTYQGFPLIPNREIINLSTLVNIPIHCMRELQEKVPIELIIHETIYDSAIQLQNKKIIPDNHDSSLVKPECFLITDEQWLIENLLCLLSNAVKYSSTHSVAVVEKANSSSKPNSVKVSVKLVKIDEENWEEYRVYNTNLLTEEEEELILDTEDDANAAINLLHSKEKVKGADDAVIDTAIHSKRFAANAQNNYVLRLPWSGATIVPVDNHAISVKQHEAMEEGLLVPIEEEQSLLSSCFPIGSFSHLSKRQNNDVLQKVEKQPSVKGEGKSRRMNPKSATNTIRSSVGSRSSFSLPRLLNHVMHTITDTVQPQEEFSTSFHSANNQAKNTFENNNDNALDQKSVSYGHGSFPLMNVPSQQITSISKIVMDSVSMSEKNPHFVIRDQQINLSKKIMDRKEFEQEKNEIPIKKIRIPSTTQSPPRDVPYLLFEISDEGVGIAEEKLETLFNPLIVSPCERLGVGGGTGLGLYTLSKRLEALGGYYGVKIPIEKNKSSSKGATFWFMIPYQPVEAPTCSNIFNVMPTNLNTTPVASSATDLLRLSENSTKDLTAKDMMDGLRVNITAANNNTNVTPSFIRKNSTRSNTNYSPKNFVLHRQNSNNSLNSSRGSTNNNYQIHMLAAGDMKESSAYPPVLITPPATQRAGLVVPCAPSSSTKSPHHHNNNARRNSHSTLPNVLQITSTGIGSTAVMSNSALGNNSSNNNLTSTVMSPHASHSPKAHMLPLVVTPSSAGSVKTTSISNILSTPTIGASTSVSSMTMNWNYNILLVDDSPTILKLTTLMLQRYGHKITIAENGEIALQLLTKHWEMHQKGYDIILMDLQMPILDGIATTQCIREKEMNGYYTSIAEAAVTVSSGEEMTHDMIVGANNNNNNNNNRYAMGGKIPQIIIAMSANSDDATSTQALAVGANTFLPKPFKYDTFLTTAKHFLHSSMMLSFTSYPSSLPPQQQHQHQQKSSLDAKTS